MRKVSDIDKTIKSYEAGYKVGFSDAKNYIIDELIQEVAMYEDLCNKTNSFCDDNCECCTASIFNNIYNMIDNIKS